MKQCSLSNNPNYQAALGYTLYMMTASRFRKATCSSHLEEKYLLCYRNLKPEVQNLLEWFSIRFSDYYLPSVLPDDIWDCRVLVRFRKDDEDSCTSIIFDGGCFALRVSFRIEGPRRVSIKYTFHDEGSAALSGQIILRYNGLRDTRTDHHPILYDAC